MTRRGELTLWRRALLALLRPLLRIVAKGLDVSDPWSRELGSVAVALAGTGARYDFAWYFEGDSRVRVRSLADIQDWLDGCRYVSDPELFHETDYWQHPGTFEQLQRGDCEDYALWAWRKLVELGYDADFVVGRCVLPPEQRAPHAPRIGGRHAWVVFRHDGETYLYEPSVKQRDRAIRPLEAVRHLYVPETGVGPTREHFIFAGFYLSLRQKLLGGDGHPVGESRRS